MRSVRPWGCRSKCERALLLSVAWAALFLSPAVAWAAPPPAPLPSLSPGESVTPSGWECASTPEDPGLTPASESCAVSSWAVIPAESPPALPMPVVLAEPAPVTVTEPLPVTAPEPLPVLEQAPQPPAEAATLTCTSPPESGDASSAPCPVAATLDSTQYEQLRFAAAVLIFFVVASSVAGWRVGRRG
jgi:hypothetical protein